MEGAVGIRWRMRLAILDKGRGLGKASCRREQMSRDPMKGGVMP